MSTIVLIDWTDASYCEAEQTMRELKPLVNLRTVGWLLRQDDVSVSIAMERCDQEETFRHIMHIPKVNIRRMRRVAAG